MSKLWPAAILLVPIGMLAWVAWSTWREKKILKAVARRVYKNQHRDVALIALGMLRLTLQRDVTDDEWWLMNNTLEKIILGQRVPNLLLKEIKEREMTQ